MYPRKADCFSNPPANKENDNDDNGEIDDDETQTPTQSQCDVVQQAP